MGTLQSAFTLARWLGPWSRASSAPQGVERTRLPVKPDGARPGFDLRIYLPRSRGTDRTILVAPGLHFAGPDDPRMDRFCAVLAASGAAVAAPFIPDFLALRVTAAAADDFARAFDAVRSTALAPPERPPIVFSVSFGSLLALRLAAARGRQVSRLVLFGGYADFAAAVRFSLTGAAGRRAPRDPLNRPVVFMNVIDHLDDATPHRDLVVAAWRRYVEATWGRPEMKERERWLPIAGALAQSLPPDARSLFLRGCGAQPGGDDACLAALARMDTRHLDPRPLLSRVQCPVDVVHGIDDDVIPHEQAHALAAALPPAARPRVHLTGLYGHTARRHDRLLAGRAALRPRQAARELGTFVRLLGLLAEG